MVLTLFLGWMPLLGLGGIILLVDFLKKLTPIRRMDIPIRFPRLFMSTIRSYLIFFYHCCSFVSRYYLFWGILFLPWAPLTLAFIFSMHLITGIGEYLIKGPRLNLPLFFLYFSLDQVSYQLGVWRGCLKRLHFGPVNPQIVRKPSFKAIR